MIVKIFEQNSNLTNEIKTLISLRKILKKKHGDGTQGLIPMQYDFG